tara:strand:+ start:651 stop:962 length:312 start_codon:yes stop_codon:yes gene_type:complete
MQHCYKKDSKIINYTLQTDPLEAMYWSTYRLKKTDVKLLDKFDRSTAAEIKQEIFDDIVSREPNPSKKSKTPDDEVSKRRKAPKPQYVETGKAKQKARRQSKR